MITDPGYGSNKYILITGILLLGPPPKECVLPQLEAVPCKRLF